LPMNAMRLNTVNLLPRDFNVERAIAQNWQCCASRGISDNFVTKAARARQGPSGSSMRASAGCALSSRIAISIFEGWELEQVGGRLARERW